MFMFFNQSQYNSGQVASPGRPHLTAALVFAAIAAAGIGICAPVALVLAHSSRRGSGRDGGLAFAVWVVGIVGTVTWIAGLILQFGG